MVSATCTADAPKYLSVDNRWYVGSPPAQEVEEQPEERFTSRRSNQKRTPYDRQTGSTINTSKTLEDCKRKAFNNAAIIFSKFKTTGKFPHGGLSQIIGRAKLQNGLENE
jgi:hypothetical protein